MTRPLSRRRAPLLPGRILTNGFRSCWRGHFGRNARGFAAAASFGLAFAIATLVGQPALAACTPQGASNITATCTGTTTNQGGGAPGTSAGNDGYGTGVETGITVNVTGTGTTVTGTDSGISVGDGTVTNNSGAAITGNFFAGINANSGAATVTNSGSITGTNGYGIYAQTNATVTNNSSAAITGNFEGIETNLGAATVINSGSITGTNGIGIYAHTNATVTNNSGASITGGNGIYTASGAATVTNSGSIIGTTGTSIFAETDATVTNNVGASITGHDEGIATSSGAATVTNSGSITGNMGIFGFTNATVTNNAGASITGASDGIYAFTRAATVTNSGSIAGTNDYGIYAQTNATVTNNAGGSIKGFDGIFTGSGAAVVTNSGSIAGTNGDGIYAGSSAAVTNSAGGSITGATYGISAVGGGSSVFNAGTISGGTAAIQFGGGGNTLTLAPGSVITGSVRGSGSDTFQLGGTGAATFDVSQLGPAAQYQAFGTFNKIESSTWTLTGTSTFAGAVNVNGGILSVNGDISPASSVTVNAGGTLGGNGALPNTTVNGGTLAPGDAIGVLTVHGNLVFTAASSYLVGISGTNADRTSITGTAALGGATVSVVPVGTISNQRYTILNATGGVIGAFNPTLMSLPDVTGSLSYDANDVYLNLALNFGAGLNVNQQNVGNALTGLFNSTGSIPAAFAGLTPAGLTQISGETATGIQQTTFDAMNLFMGVLTDPFMQRNGAAGSASGAQGFEEETEPPAYVARSRTDAFAMFTKAPPGASFEQRWSVWTAGFGGSQSTDGNAALGSNDSTSRIAAGVVGANYVFSPDTIAGFALAGGGTNFSVENGGTGRSDLFQAGAYLRHGDGPAYISAALAYGWQDVTTDRYVNIAGLDHLRAEFNANAYSGRLESGYRFVTPVTGGIGLTPYAAAQFTSFDLPAYAESAISGTSAFALSYAAKDVTDTRTELGLRTDKSFAFVHGILTLRSRLAWAHDFNPDRSIAATFQALPGASFVVNGATLAPDAALTTASAEWNWMNGWSAAASFEGEFSDVTRSYAGKGVIRYQW